MGVCVSVHKLFYMGVRIICIIVKVLNYICTDKINICIFQILPVTTAWRYGTAIHFLNVSFSTLGPGKNIEKIKYGYMGMYLIHKTAPFSGRIL